MNPTNRTAVNENTGLQKNDKSTYRYYLKKSKTPAGGSTHGKSMRVAAPKALQSVPPKRTDSSVQHN